MGRNFIETVSGRHFYRATPDFDIDDIATSLSNTCRFTGHVTEFYSVAEHAFLVSFLAPNPFEGLHHDDTEAYMSDIATPTKMELPEYRAMEDALYAKLGPWLGLQSTLSRDLKVADAEARIIEGDVLMKSKGRSMADYDAFSYALHMGWKVKCWSPKKARAMYMGRHRQLVRHMQEDPIGYSKMVQARALKRAYEKMDRVFVLSMRPSTHEPPPFFMQKEFQPVFLLRD